MPRSDTPIKTLYQRAMLFEVEARGRLDISFHAISICQLLFLRLFGIRHRNWRTDIIRRRANHHDFNVTILRQKTT